MSNARKKAFRNNRRKRKEQAKLQPEGDKLIFLKRLGKFHALSEHNLDQLFGPDSKDIVQELLKDGYIKKGAKPVKIKKEEIKYFVLTNSGQKFLKNKGEKIYSSNSARHDIIHATNVIESFKEDLDFYKHEKELRESCFRDCSRVDGAFFYPNGDIVYVETVTRHYSSDKIEAKQNYVDTYGGDNASYIKFKEWSKGGLL